MTPPSTSGGDPSPFSQQDGQGDLPRHHGPPWRADGGGPGPWSPHGPGPWSPHGPGRAGTWGYAARARARERRRTRWPGRRGFGCLFGVLFVIVVGSVVAVVATSISSFGALPAVIVAATVVIVLARLGQRLFLAARSLDRLVDLTRRVEAGDYTARIGTADGPKAGLAIVRELTRSFDTMVARLEADERQRRTLLADVSHELRTPLTIITGNLEAIVDGIHPADAAHLTPILDETRVMERLIEDLRTVALSEAGTLTLHPEPTDPDVLIGEVLQAFAASAASAGITMTTDVTGDLPIIDIDPVRIREVLSNLVANALRHTPVDGTITIAGTSSQRRVRLMVRDTGSGIDPALLPHVFDRFVKGSDSRGSGLGLAIARGLVEAHGGTIKVESTAGIGTAFVVELPRTTGE